MGFSNTKHQISDITTPRAALGILVFIFRNQTPSVQTCVNVCVCVSVLWHQLMCLCLTVMMHALSLTDFEGLVFVRLATGVCVFQVTGRESFKADRASRPVKIAESDADVSEALILKHRSRLFACLFSQPTAEKRQALPCVCVYLSSGKQRLWREGIVCALYTVGTSIRSTQWGPESIDCSLYFPPCNLKGKIHVMGV